MLETYKIIMCVCTCACTCTRACVCKMIKEKVVMNLRIKIRHAWDRYRKKRKGKNDVIIF